MQLQSHPSAAAAVTAANPSPKTSPWSILALLAVLALWGIDFAMDIRGLDFPAWLDPAMYLAAAREIRHENWAPRSLLIPTLYPYSFALMSRQVSGALWANFMWIAVLVAGLAMLRQSLRIKAPAWLVAVVVLTSPVVVGLSRTLFCEFMLASMLTLTYAFWIHGNGFARGQWVFAGAFALALLSKPTAPLFLAGPVVFQAVFFIVNRQIVQLKRFASMLGIGLVIALVIHCTLLIHTFRYYQHRGWTDTGAMMMIGPGDRWAPASLLYYIRELPRSGLGLTTLLAPLALLAWRWRRPRESSPAPQCRQTPLWVILALWLVVPIVALTFVPMKEPRHFLPCVVPAVLLIFLGLSSLPTLWRRISWGGLLFVCVAQYLLMTHHVWQAPYFVDRPMGFDRLAAAILPPPPNQAGQATIFGAMTPREFDWQHWAFGRNFAVRGFSAEEAFELSWVFAPAVLYDLDRLPDKASASMRAYDQFADLFSYTHFSLYNWRLGWRRPYFTIAPEVVIRNADFILVRDDPSKPLVSFSDHVLQSTVDTPRGRVQIYASRQADTTPYREIYARAYLDQLRLRGEYDLREVNTIAYAIVIVRMLLDRPTDVADLRTWFPQGYVPTQEKYPVHWFGGRTAKSVKAFWDAYHEFIRQWQEEG